MTPSRYLPPLVCLAALFTGCSSPPPVKEAEKAPAPAESTAPRIYVTNEVSGDMTVIDSGTNNVIATVPLGKRPRGIHASPDRKTIYVALSGSPIAGPGVDESTLPPPDKSADGIGVFDVAPEQGRSRASKAGPIRRTSISARMGNKYTSPTKTMPPSARSISLPARSSNRPKWANSPKA